MSYQTALTIKKVIEEIEARKYLLPSIQREFVWEPKRIERLFDSLMVDYPISTFLFWKVPRDKSGKFRFYEFLRNYHQRDSRHNPTANINGSEDIIAILDGQQRMTSLYIGLKGTYAYKLPYKRWDNPHAYPVRRLYLDLMNEPEDNELHYLFSFLTDAEVKEANEERDDNGARVHYWFLVGDILNIREEAEVNEYLIDHDLNTLPTKEQNRFANKALYRLYTAIHKNPTISYYLEESSELDKVLNIFIRINSGGISLSYSDLLLSFATAQWEQRDARETINSFVDELNLIGNGFNIDKDMILKSCLVLSDFSDIRFKVDNFDRDNMLVIERNWDIITRSIQLAVQLVASFGFSRDNIASNYILIPIACYIKHIGSPANFVTNRQYETDRQNIKKWFVASVFKRVFSLMPDGVLKPVRELIQNGGSSFPLPDIIAKFKGTSRDLSFNDDEIENLLYIKYSSRDALVALSILYPSVNLSNVVHIDHMYPRSQFTAKRLEKRGIPAEKREFYLNNVDYLGNLQLLEGSRNTAKNDMDFDAWLKSQFPDALSLQHYQSLNHVPDCDVSFGNFEEFFTRREELIVQALKKELPQ